MSYITEHQSNALTLATTEWASNKLAYNFLVRHDYEGVKRLVKKLFGIDTPKAIRNDHDKTGEVLDTYIDEVAEFVERTLATL